MTEIRYKMLSNVLYRVMFRVIAKALGENRVCLLKLVLVH